MAARREEREVALAELSAEFQRNGFGEAPRGLTRLLESYARGARAGESAEEMRSRIYKRLWCILWFGSKVGKESVGDGVKPTYVYPLSLKRVVRSLLPRAVRDYPNPTGSRVYNVNIGDLARAKWPASRT